jgi:hypothetical protein
VDHAHRLATIDLVQDDLLCTDPLVEKDADRVTVAGSTLEIATRDRLGPCSHRFELADGFLTLRRESTKGTTTTRTILDRVSRFEAQLLEETHVTVTIVGTDGVELTRTWSVP